MDMNITAILVCYFSEAEQFHNTSWLEENPKNLMQVFLNEHMDQNYTNTKLDY